MTVDSINQLLTWNRSWHTAGLFLKLKKKTSSPVNKTKQHKHIVGNCVHSWCNQHAMCGGKTLLKKQECWQQSRVSPGTFGRTAGRATRPVCVCMCTCICVYVYVISVNICFTLATGCAYMLYIYMYICIYACVDVYVCMYIYLYVCMPLHIYVYVHGCIYICMCMCMCMCVYIYVYVCVYLYICISISRVCAVCFI